jgi:anti-anti-sigma regulatory factor
MEAAPQQVGQQPQADEAKLKIDKFADGQIVCLKFAGTVDEDFDGKKLAATVKAQTLVLDLEGIRKISSFGIREWVDFMNAIEKNCQKIILLECAPKVVDQLNMVANFAGSGQVFSFYAPYRCDYCDSDSSVLMQVDSDWEVIKTMKPPERPCSQCGEPEYFDEDPTTYFSFIAGQEQFELEPDVAAFLSSKLNYTVSEAAQKLRIDKIIEGRSTYLKLAGNLDGSFPREKLAEGMEGTVILDVSGMGKIDPAGAAEWRGFLQMCTPGAEAIYLLGVPPVFLEKLTKPEDMGPKAQVITFAMPYSCAKCATTSSQLIDVEQHYDVLKFATPPEMKCSDCKSPTTCAATEGLLSHLPSLPKPSITPQTRKFIKDVQTRKPEKKKKATTVAEAAAQGKGAGAGMMMGMAVLTAALVLGGVFAYQYMNKKKEKKRDAVGKKVAASAEARPGWIKTTTFFASDCVTNDDESLSCYGISSYLDNLEDARAEASEAGLEALVNAVGWKIEDSAWVEGVRKIYEDTRNNKLTRFDKMRSNSDDAKYDRAKRAVRTARKAVAAAFKETGGAAYPTQPTEDYWEEYSGKKYLSFVRYTIGADQVKAMINQYKTSKEAMGLKVVSVFPGIAWRYPEIQTGAVIIDVSSGELATTGLTKEYIVTSVQDRQIKDADAFSEIAPDEVKRLKKEGGSLKLVVKTGDLQGSSDFKIPFAKIVKTPKNTRPRGGSRGGSRPRGNSGGINTWDKYGGGGVDDPTQ